MKLHGENLIDPDVEIEAIHICRIAGELGNGVCGVQSCRKRYGPLKRTNTVIKKGYTNSVTEIS